ncbi:MAG: ABC transporter ATP-binding protein/permease [Lachnospiraceae bacterium]|nr:ABC transporter ATP-binding protein/permease [Lachnospiraceae bacterium]
MQINLQHYLRVAGFIRFIKIEIFLKIFLGLCVTATYVLQAICLSRGIALVFAHSSFENAILWYLLAATLIVLRALLVRYMEGYTKKVAGKVKTVIREQLIEKLLALGPGYQSDKRSGKMQSLLTDGVEYLEPYLVNYIPQIFVVALSVIPMIWYISSLNTAAGMLLLLAVLVSIIVPYLLMPFTQKSCIGYWREYAVLNSQYVDTMQGMNTLKLLAAEDDRGAELASDSEKFRYRQIVNTRNSLFSSAAMIFMMGAGTSITTGIAAYACNDGKLDYAALLTIMFLVIECIRPIGDMNNHWHSSYMGLSVSKELLEILDEALPVKEADDPQEFPSEAGKLPELSFEDVTFQYSKNREVALRDLNFMIRPGQTVAFVGESGSGKSTILNLLLRFYDGYEGRISVNGQDIRQMKLEELRENIAVVFQNSFLFYGSVMENLRIANPEASDEEVMQAARIACAHDFIMELEHGYDTLVGERGVTLSGGQRQRLSIARAILKKAPILVMDEATSSVDAQAEKVIQETMEKLQGSYTTILIAHRLSTIRHADRIFVLNKGRLVEEGRHDELIRKDGYYKALVEAQEKGQGI